MRFRIVAGVMLLSAVVAVPQASAASKRDAALTASIRKALATTAAPGAIVGVWEQGKAPYVRTFGVRNTTTRRPMRSDLYMRIGSETKTFTVTALLQLVDQGNVALDDPISKYVPGVISGDVITLRQLAQMRSGLVNYSVVKAFDRSLTAHPHQTWTPQRLLSYSISGPLLFAPGTELNYSNTNTILLGLVVEKVSGEAIGDYIRQHITAPLGMTQTSFPTGSALPSPHAQGYANSTPDKRTANATNWNPTWTWSAGQMVSTLRDLRIWAPRLATGRGLLSDATQRVRAASVAGPGDPFTYGIGMFNVHGWIGHNGSLPGYQTIALYRLQTKTTIVALMNADIETRGAAPSTIIGRAITRVISPRNVYTLPGAPSDEE
jgi:D-alanyl-D-alanine carboxypeptidase